MSDIYQAALLGLVEGLTEFLPVSSTGHLILVGSLLEFLDEKGKSFQIFIQLGAILAVVVLYFRRFLGLIKFRPQFQDGFSGFEGLSKIAVAISPIILLGYLFGHSVKEHLFNPIVVASGSVVGGVAILWIEWSRWRADTIRVEDVALRQALLIGLFQCVALWPGISRAGATILGALIVGLDRKTAAELSFLIAVPVLAAASSYEMISSYHLLSGDDLLIFGTGFLVSFLSALVAVKFFVSLLQHWTLKPFAYYRLILGCGIILWLYAV